jgi:hypothetical protein
VCQAVGEAVELTIGKAKLSALDGDCFRGALSLCLDQLVQAGLVRVAGRGGVPVHDLVAELRFRQQREL